MGRWETGYGSNCQGINCCNPHLETNRLLCGSQEVHPRGPGITFLDMNGLRLIRLEFGELNVIFKFISKVSLKSEWDLSVDTASVFCLLVKDFQ